MSDPHADDYFSRAARRLGALTDQQLAEIRHLRHISPDKPLGQIAMENAYLDHHEFFSVLQEADRIRARDDEKRKRRAAVPWLAMSLTASGSLLLGFVVGFLLVPAPDAPPPSDTDKKKDDRPPLVPTGKAQPLLDLGQRMLDEAAGDQFKPGHSWRVDEKLRSAIEHLTAACALEPENAAAFLARGQVRKLLSDWERAELDFARAIELSPNSSQSHYERALVRIERSLEWSGLSYDPAVADASVSWRKQAAEDFQRARDLGLSGPAGLVAEAAIAWQRDGVESAYALCGSSLWTEASSEELHRIRGEILAAKNEFGAAEAALSEAVKKRPHYPEAHLSRGLVRLKLGQNREAVEDFTSVIERRRFLERALFHRGQAYFALGRYNSSINDWSRCLDLGSPRADRIRDLLREAESRTKF